MKKKPSEIWDVPSKEWKDAVAFEKREPTKVVIMEDGWVTVSYLDEKGDIIERGLGDLGVDVVIEDNRTTNKGWNPDLEGMKRVGKEWNELDKELTSTTKETDGFAEEVFNLKKFEFDEPRHQ